MKWVRFSQKDKTSYGFIMGDIVMEIEGLPYVEVKQTGHTFSLDSIKLLAPCEPEKIVCVGHNYLDHIKEMNAAIPTEPTIFLKPPTTVIGPSDDIIYPALTSNLHYEGELAVVIKKDCKNIKREDAGEYIFGVTCANDVTARDLQLTDVQWTRGKGFDTFCPIGPCIETDFDFDKAWIKTTLNGDLKQSSDIDQLVFKVPEIIEYIASVMTLKAGDVILTGTSSGVGAMQNGDTVIVEIENIGMLENTVRKELVKR